MIEAIAFISGAIAMLLAWFWIDNNDRRQYRIGYRDGYNDAKKEREDAKVKG